MPTDSYTVEAVLSARDAGMASTVKSAIKSIQELKTNAKGKLSLKADSSSAQKSVDQLKDKLKQIPKKTEAVLSAKNRADSILKNLTARLKEMDGKRATATLSADSTDAEMKVGSAQAKVRQYSSQKATASLDADDDQLSSKLSTAKGDVEAFNSETASATLDADDDPASSKIVDVQSKLKGLDSQKASAEVDANTSMADSKIADVISDLDRVTDTDAKPSVSLNDNATDKLDKIISLLSNIEQTVYAVVELQDNATGPLTNIENRLDSLEETHTIPVEVQSNAEQSLGGLKSSVGKAESILSGLKHGILESAGGSIFNHLTSQIPQFIDGMQSSRTAMQNMSTVLGYFDKNTASSAAELAKMQGEQDHDLSDIQGYAQQTIYSTTDMDQAYAQMVGTGVKGAANIVQAFGNIAASASDPQQAMQTIMTQMTQMAANGKADWADMKLVFQQAGTLEPQVAKEMGMTVAQMQDAMSKGKISAQDMLDAVARAANDGGGILGDAAKTFHTIPQALDGISEDIEHKMLPVFNSVSDAGVSMLIDLNNDIDSSGIGQSFEDLGDGVKDFFSGLKDSGATDVFNADVKGMLTNLANFNESLANNGTFKQWGEDAGNVIKTVSDAFSGVGPVLGTIGDKIGEFGDKLATVKIGSSNLRDIGIAALGSVVGVGFLTAKVKKFGEKFSGLSSLNPFKGFGQKTSEQMDEGQQAASKGSGLIEKIFQGLGTSIGGLLGGIGKGFFDAFANVPVTGLLAGAAAIGIFEAALAGLGAMRGLIKPVFDDLTADIGYLIGVIADHADGIKTIMDGLSENIQSTGSAIATAFEGIGSGIHDALDGAGDFVHDTLDGVAEVIDAVGEAADKAGDGFKSMADGAAELGQVNFATLGANLAEIATFQIGTGFTDFLNMMTGDSFGKEAEGLQTLASALQKISTASGAIKVLDSLQNFSIDTKSIDTAAQSLDNLKSKLQDLAGGGGGSKSGGGGWLDGLKNLFGGGGDSSQSGGGGGMLSGLNAQIKAMSTSFATAGKTIDTMIAKINSLKTAFAGLNTGGGKGDKGGGMFAGMSTSLTQVSTKLGQIKTEAASVRESFAGMSIGKAFAGATTQINSVSTAMTRLGQSARSGIVTGMNQAASAATSGVSRIVSAISAGTGRAQSAGNRIGQGASNGLRFGLTPAPGYARTAVNAVISAMSGRYQDAYSAGANIGQGLADGISSMIGAVQSAADKIASIVNEAIAEKHKIASPSKVQYQNGRWIGQGLVNGMLSMVEDTQKAANRMAGFTTPMPSLSMAGVPAGTVTPDLNVTLHSDIYMDSTKVGYSVARPVQDRTERDAKIKRWLKGEK